MRAELLERFLAGAQTAGAEVLRAPDPAAALSAARSVMKDAGISAAVFSENVLSVRRQAEMEAGWPEAAGDIAAAQAAVVAADYGAAATGTLVRLDSGDAEKLMWTLPPLCICLLPAAAVVADLESLSDTISAHLMRTGVPGPQVSFVTGPSRTADIECELTIGVQGPGRLVIVLVDSRGAAKS